MTTRSRPDPSAQRRLREAIRCFDEVLDIHPTNWQAMVFMGKAFESLGKREQALETFLRAHECAPTQVGVAVEAGAAAGRLGRHDVAVRVLEMAARHHPEDPRLPCNLGISFLLMGNLAGARSAFERAIVLEPERKTNQGLLDLVNEVESGKRRCPRSEAEIAKALS
jgi:Flp pilus assembly protein TadD